MSEKEEKEGQSEQKNSKNEMQTTSKNSGSKVDALRQMIPSQRSYDSVIRKIEQIVDEEYEKTISEFTALLENDKIVRENFGTEEVDDSWKKDPTQLSDDELKREIEVLKKKISNINAENAKLKKEVDTLHSKEDSIDQANHVLLNDLVNNSSAEE